MTLARDFRLLRTAEVASLTRSAMRPSPSKNNPAVSVPNARPSAVPSCTDTHERARVPTRSDSSHDHEHQHNHQQQPQAAARAVAPAAAVAPGGQDAQEQEDQDDQQDQAN